jgi:hypothetical protein
MKWRALMWILWPSFLMAGAASAVVFALVDPLDVAIFGYIRLERDFLYAAGFFFFWLVAAGSSALTLFMAPIGDPD